MMKRLRKFFGKHYIFLVYIFVLLLGISYAILSILRHMHFQSGGFDLGLYDQAVWRFSQFLPIYNTVKERLLFGDHVVLTLPLLAPFFYLWNDARVLLIIQAFAIALSAIPIFFVAKKRLQSIVAAFAVMILYSLFYGVQYGIFFDFHPILLGVSLLSCLMYSLEFEKKKMFWIVFILCLLTQENMGIALFCLGFCYIFRKPFRKKALLMMSIGMVYSLIAVKISGMLSPVGYQYWPEISFNPIVLFQRLFDTEEKRQVWLYSYSWFSFLPLFSPGSLLATLADLSQYFVTGKEFSRMCSPFMHHRAILTIFLTMGTIDILVILKKWKMPIAYISVILLLVAGFCQLHFHFALSKVSKAEYWKEEAWMHDTRALLQFVPKDGSVATQQNLVPHLSHRKDIYLIFPRLHDIKGEPCGQSLCWWLDFGGKPEYLVIDTRPNQWLTQILEINEHWIAAITNMEKVGVITKVKEIGGARFYTVDNDVIQTQKK